MEGVRCHNAQLTSITPTYTYTFNANLMMLFGQRYTITFFLSRQTDKTNRKFLFFFRQLSHKFTHMKVIYCFVRTFM